MRVNRLQPAAGAAQGSSMLEALVAVLLISASLLAAMRSTHDALAVAHNLRQRFTAMQLHADAIEPALHTFVGAREWPLAERDRLQGRAASQLRDGRFTYTETSAPQIHWLDHTGVTGSHPGNARN